MFMGSEYVSGLRPPLGLLSPRRYSSVESYGEMILTRKSEELGEKPFSVSLYPQQI
jgi:hypothetical protein